MSSQAISPKKVIEQLRADKHDVTIIGSVVMIQNVPYLDSKKKINYGHLFDLHLLSNEPLNNRRAHTMHFSGKLPHHLDGSVMHEIFHSNVNIKYAENLYSNIYLSNQPKPNGYSDYYEKIKNYIRMITLPAYELKKDIKKAEGIEVKELEINKVFKYTDTNSTRAGILSISEKYAKLKIGIVGLGGTGSYILDFLAKTPVEEVHLFDFDEFDRHNAFRTPGAANKKDFYRSYSKVEYLSKIYSNMRYNIKCHNEKITLDNISELNNLNFVFICIDGGRVKDDIINYLIETKIEFIDTGIGIKKVEEKLIGTVNVVKSDYQEDSKFYERITSSSEEDLLYDSNIQIAEINALAATLAIIKWKQSIGIYVDYDKGNTITYNIEQGGLINEKY
ncbi:ThiF family adenylyltransferase [Mycoplasmatota bacterium]|nr:ThiF family adenylyltransferase [Mycoplasmatota bacterium]